jgi:transcription elongation GreA/GreB family factor
MNPEEFQSYVASGRLTQAQVKKLLTLSPGTFCTHRSWGFGKIESVDLVLDQIFIDFPQKPKHPMQLAYAADSLTVIPVDHILALKSIEPQKLKNLCEENPAEVISLFAKSFDQGATIEKLESILTKDVFSGDWKKWIATAKRESKKSGLIVWPTKKNESLRALSQPETASDSYRARLAQARTLPDLLGIAEDVLKKLAKSAELKTLIPEIIKALDEHITINKDKNPAVVIEAIWVRDDLLKFGETSASSVGIQSLVQEIHNVHELVADLSLHRQKHILPIIKQSFPDWEARIKTLIPTSGGRLLTEIIDFLVSESKDADLVAIFQRNLFEHKVGTECLIWLCKNRDEPSYAKWLPQLINGRLLSIILHQLETIALEAGGHRKNPLSDLLLSDATLIVDLVRECDAEETKDLGKAILLNPAVEELDKRSLMGRLIKVSPGVQALLVSNNLPPSESLVVSWESLERRKQEYEEIVNKKIPENSKEIAIARSYGDLRENHEFKAAKEMQTVLMRQKAELEQMLTRARGTDFYKPDTSAVNVGTKVTLQPLDNGPQETFSILGAWDSDPEKGIISYQAGIATAILGKKIGEEASLPGDKATRPVRIVSIEPAISETQTQNQGDSPSSSSLQEARA